MCGTRATAGHSSKTIRVFFHFKKICTEKIERSSHQATVSPGCTSLQASDPKGNYNNVMMVQALMDPFRKATPRSSGGEPESPPSSYHIVGARMNDGECSQLQTIHDIPISTRETNTKHSGKKSFVGSFPFFIFFLLLLFFSFSPADELCNGGGCSKKRTSPALKGIGRLVYRHVFQLWFSHLLFR